MTCTPGPPLCDRCAINALGNRAPVHPELHESAAAAVIGEPAQADIDTGRPMTGDAGQEVARGLVRLGVHRAHLSYHLAVSCPLPMEPDKLKRAVVKANAALPPEQHVLLPVDACRPRLFAELAEKRNVLAFGKGAYEALIPPGVDDEGRARRHPSIDAVAGTLFEVPCYDGQIRRVVPTQHPRRVAKQLRWRLPFLASLSRAVRWFRGQLHWQEPAIVYQPDLSTLHALAATWPTDQWVAADIETDALEPLLARLRCVQVGTTSKAFVVATLSVDGTMPYGGQTQAALQVMASFLRRVRIVGHNFGWYDRQALQAAWMNAGLGADPPSLDLDTVILHRYVDPDLPHGLGFVASTYTDVHAWKADHTAVTAKTDQELWRYGALDVVVNARVVEPLLQRAAAQYAAAQRVGPDMRPVGGAAVELVPGAPRCLTAAEAGCADPVLVLDHQLQAVCCEMHQVGIAVDQAKRAAWAKKLIAQEVEWNDKLQGLIRDHAPSLLGQNGFNPRSPDAMRELLFSTWDLPLPEHLPQPTLYTSGGDRSVGDAILRAYMANLSLESWQHAIIHAARRAKKARSLYGRFVRKIRPYGTDPDLDFPQRDRLATSDEEEGGDEDDDEQAAPVDHYALRHDIAVWQDGRLRVNWNVHGTGVGRLSSGGRPSKINLQTIPVILRDCFVPGDSGDPSDPFVFVGADLASVHLRNIANMWRPPSLIADYRGETRLKDVVGDPHATLAHIVFGQRFLDADGWPCEANNHEWTGNAKLMRNVAKSLRYAGAYGASVPTIHATMTRAEDKDGNLVHRTLTVPQVRGYYEAWMGKEPEWQRAWDREMALFRRYGFVLSPILGRRADFADGEDFNKLANYRILSAEGDVMGPATVRVRNQAPPGFSGRGSGIVGQFHDQIVVACRRSRAGSVKALLEREMYAKPPGWDIPVIAEGKVGTDWTFKTKVVV